MFVNKREYMCAVLGSPEHSMGEAAVRAYMGVAYAEQSEWRSFLCVAFPSLDHATWLNVAVKSMMLSNIMSFK